MSRRKNFNGSNDRAGNIIIIIAVILCVAVLGAVSQIDTIMDTFIGTETVTDDSEDKFVDSKDEPANEAAGEPGALEETGKSGEKKPATPAQQSTKAPTTEAAQQSTKAPTTEAAQQSAKAGAVATIAPTVTPTKESAYKYTFRNEDRLEDHYEKHGIEMGFASADDYLAAANKVIASPDALTKTEQEDGDYVFYIESTNEFVILSTDGYIRTYFICDGKDYFDRQ